jgi:hypothetical protein
VREASWLVRVRVLLQTTQRRTGSAASHSGRAALCAGACACVQTVAVVASGMARSGVMVVQGRLVSPISGMVNSWLGPAKQLQGQQSCEPELLLSKGLCAFGVLG